MPLRHDRTDCGFVDSPSVDKSLDVMQSHFNPMPRLFFFASPFGSARTSNPNPRCRVEIPLHPHIRMKERSLKSLHGSSLVPFEPCPKISEKGAKTQGDQSIPRMRETFSARRFPSKRPQTPDKITGIHASDSKAAPREMPLGGGSSCRRNKAMLDERSPLFSSRRDKKWKTKKPVHPIYIALLLWYVH